MLIAHGPSHEALIKSPIFRAMESGTLARFEEITRCAVRSAGRADLAAVGKADLASRNWRPRCPPQKGFSIIATANTRDRGVNDMSAALKRRFNIVVLPTPKHARNRDRHRPQARPRTGGEPRTAGRSCRPTRRSRRSSRSSASCGPARRSTARTSSRRRRGVLSTAEAISVLANSMALAGQLRHGRSHRPRPRRRAARVRSSRTRRRTVVWQEYLSNVLKKRGAEWRPLFTACSEHNCVTAGRSMSSACGTCRRRGRGSLRAYLDRAAARRSC